VARKPRPCWVCGEPTLVKNVADERTIYPGNRQEVMCKTCMTKKVKAAIAKNRKDMGLHDSDRQLDGD
jgi:hypothetical protein